MDQSIYCTICYAFQVKTAMACGTYICKVCMSDWAKNRIIRDRISGEINIPCPNYQCDHAVLPVDLLAFLGPKEFEEVNSQFTDLYLSHTEDVRRGPSEKCSYAGTIAIEACGEPLECPECNAQWREFMQMTNYQKTVKAVKDLLSFKSETFSYFNEIITGSPGPKCGMVIWKDGGCSHMVGQKCKFEFGWHGLGHFPGYNHREQTFCPLRTFITFVCTLVMLISVNIKLGKSISFIGSCQFFIVYGLWLFVKFIVFPNLFILGFGLCFLFFAIAGDAFRSNSSSTGISKVIYCIFAILYPALYFFVWYKIYYSVTFNFMLWTIYYEVALIVGGILLMAGIYLIIFFAKPIFLFIIRVLSQIVRKTYQLSMISLKGANKCRQFFYTTKNEKKRMKSVLNIKRKSNSFKKSKH